MSKNRKQYSMSGLLETIQDKFSKLEDKGSGKYRVSDCLLAGLGMFYLKMPSLLQYVRTVNSEEVVLQSNLSRLYKIEVPSDTHFRVKLDGVDPSSFQSIYDALCLKLQRGKVLELFKQSEGFYLVAIDGTQYFSSEKVHCKNCCVKESARGVKTYYHQVLSAVMVDPARKQVIPLAVEPIVKQDGSNKNDCERNAAVRLLRRLKSSHKNLKIVVLMDALYANSKTVKLLEELKFGYIITAKNLAHMYDQFQFDGKQQEMNRSTEQKKQEFRFAHRLELTQKNPEVRCNYLEYREEAKKKFYNSWITNLSINAHNVEQITKYGRARWNIENATFNTLKNQGYNFEHNYGHGYNNLSVVLAHLMFISFTIDQIQELCSCSFQEALQKVYNTKIYLWEKMRNFLLYFQFDSWEHFYQCLIDRSKLTLW